MEEGNVGGGSICEKLFNAIIPAARPLRHLSFSQQELKTPAPAVSGSEVKQAEQAFKEREELIKIQSIKWGPSRPPPPPPPAKETGSRPGRNQSFNERADDFIHRTRMRFWSGSAVGKHDY
ncbi:hypothetical protein HPP92_001188 [Vanilla planifolia]|uniref:Uncharacterized protein n=1 Tax=Vanilla planifolia TaxID=51239 RepID=A0A835VLL9_VANPL|nr:hypothetical protein HPP92_001337 [Vanilla planifolia]KAG0501116.1 hypothetical protein HPP92_001188 [Vanilla planifolia]